jgi:ketosteroid isomerase-like protein
MIKHTRLQVLAGLVLLCGTSIPTWGATPDAPRDTVAAFNAAISERRLDAALKTLAAGSVNFNLASAHSFTAAPGSVQPLTTDLTTHWRSIAPVLFSANRRYTREVVEATTHVDGDLAVVWVRMRTRSEPPRGAPTMLVFSETYLLRREQAEWKIMGIANSRQTR